jgi:hypothetical protein
VVDSSSSCSISTQENPSLSGSHPKKDHMAAHPPYLGKRDGAARAVPPLFLITNQDHPSTPSRRITGGQGLFPRRVSPRRAHNQRKPSSCGAVHDGKCVRNRPQIPRPKQAGYHPEPPYSRTGRSDGTARLIKLKGMGVIMVFYPIICEIEKLMRQAVAWWRCRRRRGAILSYLLPVPKRNSGAGVVHEPGTN